MDLLAAYNSDSDSDNGEGTLDAAPAMSSSTLPVAQNETTGKAVQAPGKSANEASASKAKKRGKKMLKLSAVLPEHIWNQLTGAATGGDGFDADSSGGEESDNDVDDGTKKKAAKKAGKPHKPLDFSSSSTTATAKDSGLQSLMQELSRSKAAASAAETSERSPPMSREETKSAESESLGFAFVTSTVETTKRKRSGKEEVRDIHASTAATASEAPPSPKSSAPLPVSTISRPTVSRTVPYRPAAPLPVGNRNAAPATATYPTAPASQSFSGPATNSHGGGGKKKLSRKRQMEQMLRAGKLDQVEGDHVVEGVASTYQPSEFDSGPSYNSHGVRVVPTSSYNVSTGSTTASTEVTGRQRNKHQLNSLLASAASLEAQRAQNPHLSARSTGSGSSHRATAKRKYGW